MNSETFSKILRKSRLARRIFVSSINVLNTTGYSSTAFSPNLIIIGAQKSGTTSLHNYLGQHPEIFMSYFKEPGYFLNPTDDLVENTSRSRIRLQLSDKNLLDLISIGKKDQKWFGESSTYYSMHPVFGSEVPYNISHRSPDARIIYLLRNPFERIISQFLWGESKGFSSGTFSEVLEKRLDIMSAISSYGSQLEHYTKMIERDRILVLRFEHLSSSPALVFDEVCKFLDVSMVEAGNMNFPQHNTSKNRKKHGNSELKFPKEIFDTLREKFQHEIDLLENISGLDFSDWDLSEETWVNNR